MKNSSLIYSSIFLAFLTTQSICFALNNVEIHPVGNPDEGLDSNAGYESESENLELQIGGPRIAVSYDVPSLETLQNLPQIPFTRYEPINTQTLKDQPQIKMPDDVSAAIYSAGNITCPGKTYIIYAYAKEDLGRSHIFCRVMDENGNLSNEVCISYTIDNSRYDRRINEYLQGLLEATGAEVDIPLDLTPSFGGSHLNPKIACSPNRIILAVWEYKSDDGYSLILGSILTLNFNEDGSLNMTAPISYPPNRFDSPEDIEMEASDIPESRYDSEPVPEMDWMGGGSEDEDGPIDPAIGLSFSSLRIVETQDPQPQLTLGEDGMTEPVVEPVPIPQDIEYPQEEEQQFIVNSLHDIYDPSNHRDRGIHIDAVSPEIIYFKPTIWSPEIYDRENCFSIVYREKVKGEERGVRLVSKKVYQEHISRCYRDSFPYSAYPTPYYGEDASLNRAKLSREIGRYNETGEFSLANCSYLLYHGVGSPSPDDANCDYNKRNMYLIGYPYEGIVQEIPDNAEYFGQPLLVLADNKLVIAYAYKESDNPGSITIKVIKEKNEPIIRGMLRLIKEKDEIERRFEEIYSGVIDGTCLMSDIICDSEKLILVLKEIDDIDDICSTSLKGIVLPDAQDRIIKEFYFTTGEPGLVSGGKILLSPGWFNTANFIYWAKGDPEGRSCNADIYTKGIPKDLSSVQDGVLSLSANVNMNKAILSWTLQDVNIRYNLNIIRNDSEIAREEDLPEQNFTLINTDNIDHSYEVYVDADFGNGISLRSNIQAFKCARNHPPVLDPVGNKTAYESVKLQFTIRANDPDTDQLTYFAQNLPLGARFNSATRTFSWIPGKAGQYRVRFLVRDPAGLGDSKEVNITVLKNKKIGV